MTDRRAFQQDRAGVPCAKARKREHQRTLAGSIGTDQPDDLPSADRQGDVVQDLDWPVEGTEGLDLKQGSSPRRDKPAPRPDRGRQRSARHPRSVGRD